MSIALEKDVLRALFDAPLLRGVDARDREAIERVARVQKVAAGQAVYRAGALADAVYVVVRGAVVLSGQRRGDVAPTVIRVARTGETFGEESLIVSGARSLEARAEGDAEVVEVARTVLERAFARGGTSAVANRELRFAQRAAIGDVLRMVAFARDLDATDFEILLDGARPRRVERGETVFHRGDEGSSFFLILDGLVQLQTIDEDGNPEIRAYLARGDFFGDQDALTRSPRATSAVASGVSQLVEVPREVLETLGARNPKLLASVRRIRADRQAEQVNALGQGGALTTQHVFRDAYRMQMARSLLVIDQDTCVRCGHCAWTCESLYGVSRLVRRGDKILTHASATNEAPKKSLLLPNSCQHCKNPLCMVDCPTGAIGRDPEGEVFIREDLCIGCGNCAKACPWDNIRMAPRPEGARVAESLRTSAPDGARFPEIAVKCDLCRGYEAPACVSACPTESIFRLEPTQDIREVAALFGTAAPAALATTKSQSEKPSYGPWLAALGWLCSGLSIGALVLLSRAHVQGALTPSSGLGLAAGWVSLLLMIALSAYSVPKRLMKHWLRRRDKRKTHGLEPERTPVARSKVRPFYLLHLALGVVAVVLVTAHAGLSFHATASGALGITFFLVSAFGIAGALFYRVLPSRLSRLERRGMLPEDLRGERDRLFDQMHREASGRSDLIKVLLGRLLVPYARSPLGALALLLSGRSREDEEKRLETQVHTLLEGRASAKLQGIDALLRVVVELRSLPARRLLGRALRDWLPLHLVFAGLLVGLLLLHVVGAWLR